MPRATAAEAAATAHRIRDVAITAFAHHGFAGVSVEEVAQAAGVTRGAVYHHFSSKQGLFAAVVEELHRCVADAIVTVADAAGESPWNQLVAGSHAFIDAITEGEAARVLLLEAPAAMGWAQWRALDDASSGVHLREALANCGLSGDEAAALAPQLSGAMNEAALWVSERGGDSASRRSAHAALDRLLASIR